jgi:hypothetical protein
MDINCVALQELDGVGQSVEASRRVWPEARQPSRTTKGPGERREAPEADVADLRLVNLPDSLQGIEYSPTSSATTLIVSTEAKTHETIVAHVEADLENTPQPPTWRAKCRWISCCKNTGYHTTDPKIRTQGDVRVRSWIAMKHGDGSLETPKSIAHCRKRHRALPRFRALVVR